MKNNEFSIRLFLYRNQGRNMPTCGIIYRWIIIEIGSKYKNIGIQQKERKLNLKI